MDLQSFARSRTPLPDSVHIFSSSREAVAQRRHLSGPAALLLRVARISEPRVRGELTFHTISFTDANGCGALDSGPVTDPGLVDIAQEALENGRLLCARGLLLSEPLGPRNKDEEVRLHLESLHLRFRPSALLGPGQQDLLRADATIDDLARRPGALERHLLGECNALLDVETDNLSPRFRQCQRLMLLQALSSGQVDEHTNPRLSTYVFSEPGMGKKLLSRMAMLLAPASCLIQPQTATLAGVTACVEQQPRLGWVARPGVVPRANRGVCVYEDFHQFDTPLARALRGNMLSILEDGRIAPSKAAAATYEVQAAVHLNGNRVSSVFDRPCGAGAKGRLSDLALTFDLFSRIDVPVELDCDDDPTDSAIEMSRRPLPPRTPQTDVERYERTGALKVLVARLLDRFPQVDMTPIEEQVGQLTADAIAVLRDVSAPARDSGVEVDGLLRRLANTVRKLVGAAARLDGRGVANRSDLEIVWKMVSYKLEVVRYLCGEAARVTPLGRREEVVRKAERAREQRWRDIAARFGGLRIGAAQLGELLGYGEKLVRRELRQRGLVEQGGLFDIPTPLVWEQMRCEALRREALDPAAPKAEPPTGPPADDYARPDPEEGEGGPPPDPRLPPLRAVHEPVLEGLERLADHEKRQVAQDLCKVAFEAQLTDRLTLELRGIQGLLPEGEEVPEPEFSLWLKWVRDPDREVRGLAALATYAEADLPGQQTWLEQQLGRHPDLPPRLRAGVEAVLARLKWHAGVALDRERRQQAERREREREAGAWSTG